MTILRICFIGDSITNGTGDGDFLGWPARLCVTEAARGHDLTQYNLGVRADTSRHIAARWRAEAEARLTDAFPGAMVFSFGINDMAEEEGVGIRVPLAESHSVAETIIGAAAEWKPTLWLGPAPADMAQQPIRPAPTITYTFENARTAELNESYKELAATLGVPYLDLFTPLAADPRWTAAQAAGDGVHPTADGYAMVADLVGAWSAWRAWMDA